MHVESAFGVYNAVQQIEVHVITLPCGVDDIVESLCFRDAGEQRIGGRSWCGSYDRHHRRQILLNGCNLIAGHIHKAAVLMT